MLESQQGYSEIYLAVARAATFPQEDNRLLRRAGPILPEVQHLHGHLF